jgi:hypothetical protein
LAQENPASERHTLFYIIFPWELLPKLFCPLTQLDVELEIFRILQHIERSWLTKTRAAADRQLFTKTITGRQPQFEKQQKAKERPIVFYYQGVCMVVAYTTARHQSSQSVAHIRARA